MRRLTGHCSNRSRPAGIGWCSWNAMFPGMPRTATCPIRPLFKPGSTKSLEELREGYAQEVSQADLVMVGSYVPEGIEVAEWVLQTAGGVRAFYDIDTPVTLASLRRGNCEYLKPELIPRFDLFLSFAAGATPKMLEEKFGSPCARPLLCSVDPDLYAPEDVETRFELGYLGTYSDDRQPGLDQLLLQPAREMPAGRFVVAGPQYPPEISWPENVERIEHLPPREHRRFYNEQRFTLNVTRSDMVRAGFSPSVRLFEAAACGTPIISDWWPGLDSYFAPQREILPAASSRDVLGYLQNMPESDRQALGRSARRRVLAEHTSDRRAEELEGYFGEALCRKMRSPRPQSMRR